MHRTSTRTYSMGVEGKILVEYVWIGGNYQTGDDLRSKTRTVKQRPSDPNDLPLWSFDGSSTGQASGDDSDVILR